MFNCVVQKMFVKNIFQRNLQELIFVWWEKKLNL